MNERKETRAWKLRKEKRERTKKEYERGKKEKVNK